jgi:hypothetical protein
MIPISTWYLWSVPGLWIVLALWSTKAGVRNETEALTKSVVSLFVAASWPVTIPILFVAAIIRVLAMMNRPPTPPPTPAPAPKETPEAAPPPASKLRIH